jgi:hypothetical protein
MSKRSAALLLWLSVLLLGGCATPPKPVGVQTWSPLPPASLGKPVTVTQVLRGAFGGREATLNCVVSVQPSKLLIVGTTAVGVRAFTVEFDGAAIQASAQPGMPQSFSGERLLNDVQLAYWPLAVLTAALDGTQWKVTEPASGTRRLRYGERLVAEVHYSEPAADPWQGRIWIVNLQYGYTLQLDSRLSETER